MDQSRRAESVAGRQRRGLALSERSINEIVGREYPAFSFEVEKGRISMFARAIGEDNPIHFDEDAAKAAGYRGIPAPPTFSFTIAMEAGLPVQVIEDLGVDKTKTVHGEQHFAYHGDICAGDVIRADQKIVDIFEKKGGALLFIVAELGMTNQQGDRVADLRTVTVVRNG